LADWSHPRILVVHPDPLVRGQILAALAERGHAAAVADRTLAPRPPDRPALRVGARDPERPDERPAATVVIADHTQLPIAVSGQLLVLVPADEHGAILAAFAAGADDVIAGPLRPAELVTRVTILARTAVDATHVTVGPITIDTAARSVTLDGRPLDLTRAEYDLLVRLAAAPGRVFTKHELLHAISADPAKPRPNPRSTRPNRRVDTQAARLRRRLGEHRSLLVTVWGIGYRLG
jgi:DNA-binding winged helix-turn-helix (wHTH) protein